MSGRTRTLICRAARAPKFLLVLGLLAGALVAPADSRAQDDADAKSPLPPIQPKRSIAIDRNRAIFLGRLDAKGNRIANTGIEDSKPIATEKENADEYQAWTAVVQHAKQFSQADIEEGAARDLVRDDLTMSTAAEFADLRLAPVRFEGKLTRVRRVEGSKGLKLEGTEELYEALLVPTGEPMPADWLKSLDWSVSAVFTELPESLAAVRQKPFGEWAEVNARASAAGFFFKLKRDAPGEPLIPVLIGKSVTMVAGDPVPPGPDPAALDKDLRIFRRIRNDEPFPPSHDHWEEGSAWERVLLHARRFSPDDLEGHAAEVPYATLFNDGRRELELPGGRKGTDYKGQRDYKLDLVKFEGRLRKLDRLKPGPKLAAAGVETAYEGWVVPKGEPDNHLVCVVFTDPPEGVEPTGLVNQWGSFAGYAFKLRQYKSGERQKDDPTKYVTKRAPFLLGRAFVPRPDPERQGVSWGDFATAALAGVVGLGGFVVVVSWWFRRGDRLARREIEAHRHRNPFGDSPA